MPRLQKHVDLAANRNRNLTLFHINDLNKDARTSRVLILFRGMYRVETWSSNIEIEPKHEMLAIVP